MTTEFRMPDGAAREMTLDEWVALNKYNAARLEVLARDEQLEAQDIVMQDLLVSNTKLTNWVQRVRDVVKEFDDSSG